MASGKSKIKILDHPLLRKYFPLVHEDMMATYSRDLHKWLIIAPIIGITTGLVTTLIAEVILVWMWPHILRSYLRHHLAIVPGVVVGFVLTGLIMQLFTSDPNEHSTEEIIRSYHEYRGHIQMRSFVPKLVAAITTVGFGGSAALEGPSIYGGGALGSWLWSKLQRFHLEPRDRRIMLLSGAAAGMAAVFRAPLTGLVFAVEVPYRDDLAHEALLPSLIASVVSYATLSSFLGTKPVFDFSAGTSFRGHQLLWSALLGLICGLLVMAFDITFRRARTFMVKAPIPHWLKLATGGFLTAICGLVFVSTFKGPLIPLGPNYEAVQQILQQHHSSPELLVFAGLKLAGALFTLAVGGVSAIFVPLFLSGGSFGVAFAQSVVHTRAVDLFGAVGMAAFIAGGYKTPLAAVTFVAEATGGHAYIIPALIGAAVAYGVSGEASVSGDQRRHEAVKLGQLKGTRVSEVMQQNVISVQASSSLQQFARSIVAHYHHTVFPVCDGLETIGTISIKALALVPPEKWTKTQVSEFSERNVLTVTEDCDLMEALRLLMGEDGQRLLLVTSEDGKLVGILTKTNLLEALRVQSDGSFEMSYRGAYRDSRVGAC
jgi:chloride channel protein, CIC family